MKKTKKILFVVTVLLLAVLAAVSVWVTPWIGIWIILTALLSGLIGYVVLTLGSRGMEEDWEDDWEDMNQTEEELVLNYSSDFPLPFLAAEEDGTILGINKDMEAILHSDGKDKEIWDFFPKFDFKKSKQEVLIHDCVFDAFCSKAFQRRDGTYVYYLSLTGAEEKENLKRQLEEEQSVCGYLYIDNYDEVAEGLDDSQVSILTALLERKLNVYVADMGGIIKRFERGRYLLVLSNKALQEAMRKKFDILNDIKNTKAGNHIPVTVSIGLGVSEESLDEATKLGKAAIDLALGRGGDQAIVKEKDKYHFFGGKSSELSHNTKIRARVKADALEGLIRGADEVFILGHKNPDMDAFGSALGLYRIATDLGKQAWIVLTEVSVGIENLYRVVSEDKTYAGIFLNESQAVERISANSLLIVADTFVNALVDAREVLEEAEKVFVIDHHRKSADYIQNAVLTYHEPYASSTCELVTEIIRNLDDKVNLRPMEADGLLSGMMLDTKRFSVKTGAVTFEAAAYLRRNNADAARVQQLFRSELNQLKMRAATISRAVLYRDGVVISVCPDTSSRATVIAAQAADELLNVIDVEAAIVLCMVGEKTYVSARSYGDINVQMLMEKAGGGGHRTMAGAQFTALSVPEVIAAVKKAVDEYFEEA